MYLADYSRHTNTAKRTRQRMEFLGRTLSGKKLWSDEEKSLCRQLHPDYKALAKALPHRSRSAIRNYCSTYMPESRIQKSWTGQEQSRFRRAYPTATWDELYAAFPGRSYASLESMAKRLKLTKKRKGYLPTGDCLLDSLRGECFRQNVSMSELDAFAGRRHYFENQCWRGKRGFYDYRAIVRAIYVMGGTLKIEWSEQ
ncbi:MAG: hypothetical protein EOR51_12000 [Mesorhizobium sp.]|uniref:hypothetical protein n=1 Tax=Mesorhizobium sp. TaxID=1871066 RepID=UPI000FE4F15C|nr:hypothetical protein [Mesorhizobium sp.]RWK79627.1 MAG: hypothetical protein EOR50_05730 [Mesorhizobium sp.]RWK82402.1 MAG: hypothetical protein EOR51_12000 [Mesorhizobium sp.]RWL08779.1 MAG: hypothetical protein EOR55_03550 [Mesorhizobium sp.]